MHQDAQELGIENTIPAWRTISATTPRLKASIATPGIPTQNWNVADFDATQTNIAAIAKEFGPADTLVNHAGITRDSTLPKMIAEQWHSVIDVDVGGSFNTCLPCRRRRVYASGGSAESISVP